MCKVYSKALVDPRKSYINEHIVQNERRNTNNINNIMKNKNHNTCSGTAFIKP